MLILVDALKIALVKIAESVVNIFIFRNCLSIAKSIVGGFWAFLLAIFISGRVRRFVYSKWDVVSRAFARESGRHIFKFDATSLESIDLNSGGKHEQATLEEFRAYVKKNSESDLFNCIFTATSQSSIILLLTVIGIEHLNNNLETSSLEAMLYCIIISFLLCFGSSFKYTQLVIADWLREFDAMLDDPTPPGHSKLNKILVTHKNPLDHKVEFVGLWLSKFDAKRNSTRVELRFLAPDFTDNVKDILDFYAKHHMHLAKTSSDETDASSSDLLAVAAEKKQPVERYELVIQDYYNGDAASKVFEKEAKAKGFESKESWTEYRSFACVNFNISIFHNTEHKKKHKIN